MHSSRASRSSWFAHRSVVRRLHAHVSMSVLGHWCVARGAAECCKSSMLNSNEKAASLNISSDGSSNVCLWQKQLLLAAFLSDTSEHVTRLNEALANDIAASAIVEQSHSARTKTHRKCITLECHAAAGLRIAAWRADRTRTCPC